MASQQVASDENWLEEIVMIVALVTARGGSKRVPGKNIRPLAGRPLIDWSIAPALAASTIDRVIVSTDDEAIADCAHQSGAEVPFLRPPELAGDYASHYDVIAHTIDWLEKEGTLPRAIVLLQPTSPFRSASLIDEMVVAWTNSDQDCLTSVCAVADHPAFMYRKTPDGALSAYLPVQEGYQRSQDQEPLYVLNGAIYIMDPQAFRARTRVLGDTPASFEMDSLCSLDIDTEQDFRLAEAFIASGLIAHV